MEFSRSFPSVTFAVLTAIHGIKAETEELNIVVASLAIRSLLPYKR